ncbi:hypothetical protein M404DRAFT_36508 [Pisolithus tinctorius Marx 270]|uniref:CCHC-type domain-containing protein n=1 Tax=Pisolithus tinctorius Marx 270 TaxID=870435 RepID=A0A0C3MVP5_PISTI|nr:hypothetical protein M404DRAFT_36508 [Pisolithus tinctorius Marx 270]
MSDTSSSSDDTSSPESEDSSDTHSMSGSSPSDDSSSSLNSDDGTTGEGDPESYDGSDDTHSYHRFVTEGTAYIEDGRVAPKKCAFVLSHYLTGKAYEFYVREVSGDPYKWRLSDFFMELFNYCFPINFRLWQREKLQACYQNSKTVKNYVYELNELWNMIGETDERAKVHKLWSGLRKELQQDLWREKLNLEISSLKRVIASAEVLEIAQSITGDYIPKSQRRRSKKRAVASAATSPEGPESSKHERRCHRRKRRDYEPRKEAASTDAHQSKGKHDGRSDKHKCDTPKLSKDEQEWHKAEGLCYICHKPGHFSRNCLTRHTVSSLSKPPRVASFGIDVNFGDVECQRQLAKSSNDDTEVTANFIHPIGPTISDEDDDVPDLESIWSDDNSEDAGNRVTTDDDDLPEGMRVYVYSRSQFLGHRSTGPTFGYPLEEHAIEWLSGICYPGDDQNSLSMFMDTRFLVYEIGDGLHMIIDSERDVLGPADAITIETRLLGNPAFQLDSWYWFRKGEKAGMTKFDLCQMDRARTWRAAPMGRPIEEAIETRLKMYSFPVLEGENQDRFACIAKDESTYEVYDYHMALCFERPAYKLGSQEFDVMHWHARRLFDACADLTRSDPTEDCDLGLAHLFERDDDDLKGEWCEPGNDFTHKVPKPLVVVVHVNGQPAHALIDTGSLADFMSVMLAEQPNVKKIPLEKPLTIQLAVQGSRSRVNFGTKVRFQYQGIDCERHFDVMNIQNYDLILGTPFLYQHQVLVGLHSPRVVIGSKTPMEMRGPQVSVLESRATEVYQDSIERAQRYLQELSKPLCSLVGSTALPPFCAINHEVPLIDEKKIYPWRPSKCPDAL